jgi:UDP-glucose:(heptosyl)LPS alpha-1,3-glucosyltransferase
VNLAFFIFNYFPYGGLERNFLRIAEEAVHRGHRVDVFTMSWQGERPQNSINITLIPGRGLTNHGQCQSFVTALQKRGLTGYDLKVGFNRMPGLDLYYNADVCYAADINRRRGPLARLTPRYRLLAAFERAVFGPDSSTHIMYLSEQEKNRYIAAYGTREERFHYLPPGIDRRRIEQALSPDSGRVLRQRLGLSGETRVLLMIGSDFVRKGVGRTIRAMAALPDAEKEKTHLVVIGKGRPAPLQRLAKKGGIISQVHFIGGSDQVPMFLAGADLLIHPAISENTGNVILEAMVAGLPVLATDTCGYGTHVNRAQAGRLVTGEPFRQPELDQALGEMAVSDQHRLWRDNARRYAATTDLYSRPQVAVGIMEQLAGRS